MLITEEPLPPETFYWLALAWLTLVGAAVGSFLNVVVYRLPAGISLLWPGSRCPLCRHPIRWFDNLPVASWILLRGRCRDCRAPIAIRYPLVEAGTAAIFLLLAVREVFSAGPAGDAALPVVPMTHLAGIYSFHLLLVCTLLAAALMAADGKRPPLRLFLPVWLIGLAAPAAWPWLHPLPAWSHPANGLLDSVIGLAAGLAAGMLAAVLLPKRQETGGFTFCIVSLGIVLGWQAGCATTIVAVLAAWLVRFLGRWWPGLERIPATAWIGLAALSWMLAL